MVFLRKYDQEFLKDLFKRESRFENRYELFEKLEEFIINSPSDVQLEAKTSTVNAYRIALDLPRRFPYWEIYWFKEFYGNEKNTADKFVPETKNIYFTFKSLLLNTDDKWLRSNYHLAKDKKYRLYRNTGVTKDYRHISPFYHKAQKGLQGIDIYVFDDISYPSLKIEDLLDLPITFEEDLTKVFTDSSNKLLDIEIKDLPMVMYLSEGSKFNSKSEDPENSIVVLDNYAGINTREGKGINGSLYMHNGSIIFPMSIHEYHIGKNIVIGQGSKISSRHIGDNVLIGNRVASDRESEVHDNVFIEDDVVLNEYAIVPAGQSITTTPPLIMSVFRDTYRYDLNDFNHLLDFLKEKYEKGTLSPFQ